jgi:hypothetical protein
MGFRISMGLSTSLRYFVLQDVLYIEITNIALVLINKPLS